MDSSDGASGLACRDSLRPDGAVVEEWFPAAAAAGLGSGEQAGAGAGRQSWSSCGPPICTLILCVN
uniref:Uncharacterized protein n=1 Tax=Arundo donax TaxID=35708 RepID=A0A0A9AVP4_ARUDO